MRGILNPATAAKVGNFVGAKYMFVGSLSKFRNDEVILVNTRLIKVETARGIGGWREEALLNELRRVPAPSTELIYKQ